MIGDFKRFSIGFDLSPTEPRILPNQHLLAAPFDYGKIQIETLEFLYPCWHRYCDKSHESNK